MEEPENRKYLLKNENDKEMFLIIDAIPKTLLCGCSNILLGAKICLGCTKSYCQSCHRGNQMCLECREELSDNKKVAMRVRGLRCKCIHCNAEMRVDEIANHPQREEDHVDQSSKCEECLFKKKINLMLEQDLCSLNEEKLLMAQKVELLEKRLLDTEKQNETLKRDLDLHIEMHKKEIDVMKTLYENEKSERESRKRKRGEERAVQSFFVAYGIGCAKDEHKAKQLCLDSSSKGSKFAEGMMHYFGWETQRNYERAFQTFYQALEEQGVNPQSKETSYCLNFVAHCWEKGHGVQRDVLKAIEFYKQAVNLENQFAMFNLALLYENGEEGVFPRDVQQALELYQRAVDLQNPFAMMTLALIYENGKHRIERDTNKALELYRRAVDLNCSFAMNTLALIYENGKHGIERDVNLAFSLYKRAAELGDDNAKLKLSQLPYSKMK